MKRLLLAGMILGLIGSQTAYGRPTLNFSDGVKWTQNASDEAEEERDPEEPGGDEGHQDENQDEGEPSSEGQDEST